MKLDKGERGPGFLWLWGLVALLFAGLLFYSQKQAFSWDEGFHLLASALIIGGKRPYLDFCFPQTPLNAYFYAGWMGLFGESWKVAHIAASILTAAAILLTADYVLARFPIREWRLAGALLAALFVGLNDTVVFFGTIAQAYALCLLFVVASFRVAVIAAGRVSPLSSAAAGLLVSAAAASSLLTAPAVPVLLGWTLIANRAGNRWTKAVAFLAAAVVPFAPVLWLFLQSPHAVLFNIVEYQLFGRRAKWEGASSHDLSVLTSWADSGPALLLGALAVAGLLFIARRRNWPRPLRLEFYLCAWLAGAMALEIGAAHPTFSWYFVFTVPFLAILAVAGLAEVAARLYRPGRRAVPVIAVSFLLTIGLARAVREDLQEMNWPKMENIARKVSDVTPTNGSIWAGEQFFFLTHREPPDGMEFQAAQKMSMPMAEAAPLHILPAQELERRVKAGAYDTIENCDDERIKELGLSKRYLKSEEFDECTVFWNKK
ncbi:MAG TPA: hypothetical protein VKX49_04915 [Bryobacteraceae bacterium]|nr:hypothetical protein [Bryobacteraceae bacterium]